jgi:hypothetical protein
MRTWTAIFIAVFACAGSLHSGSSDTTLDLTELLTAKEYNAAGLNQLSPDQVAALNRIVTRLVSESTMTGCNEELEKTEKLILALLPIESSIAGEFEGWEGDTVFVLNNGQVWQQDSYAYMYKYAYQPEVTIIPVQGRYVMLVDGVDEYVFVRRYR